MSVFLVTGASTGIGRETALLLARSAHTVFAGVRRTQDGESLTAAGAGDVRPVILDVTKPKEIAAAAALITKNGRLDGLVNNAGMASAAPLEFIPIEEFRRQIEVNLTGQLAVTQAVLPLLRASSGRIVNVTSIGGLIAGQMLGPYNASKFALEALTHVLRQELAPWGIRTIAIEPGQIATPIWGTAAKNSDRLIAELDPRVIELYGKRIAGAQNMAKNAAANGLDPVKVAEVIQTALTAKNPRTRYPVGTDAKIGSALLARLPDRLRDRLLNGRTQPRPAAATK
ncbi:SDR family NAD(P)-dependent oxidoreductase [soil metagenome]